MVKNNRYHESFGVLIRKSRIKKGIGQRELANRISVAPS